MLRRTPTITPCRALSNLYANGSLNCSGPMASINRAAPPACRIKALKSADSNCCSYISIKIAVAEAADEPRRYQVPWRHTMSQSSSPVPDRQYRAAAQPEHGHTARDSEPICLHSISVKCHEQGRALSWKDHKPGSTLRDGAIQRRR